MLQEIEERKFLVARTQASKAELKFDLQIEERVYILFIADISRSRPHLYYKVSFFSCKGGVDL
jgi:hypothetical protein